MNTSKTIQGLFLACAIALSMVLTSCGGGGGSYPGTPEGAKELLGEFLKDGADKASLSASIKPTEADAKAYFKDEFAGEAWEKYDEMFSSRSFVIGPKPDQSELLFFSATTDQINAGDDKALFNFPGGYKMVKGKFKDGITVCRFKFVEAGKTLGMAFDGLVYVNDHWVLFPKPWRIFN